MSLLDDIKKSEKRPGGTCTLGELLRNLGKADRDDLNMALADLTISASAISRALVDRGYGIKRDTVQRHRRKDCTCD